MATEVEDWTARQAQLKDECGRQQVVRNGHRPTRTLITGAGPVEVSQPRVLDRRIVGQNADGQDVDAAGQCSIPAPNSGFVAVTGASSTAWA
jgi:hypothetical protein